MARSNRPVNPYIAADNVKGQGRETATSEDCGRIGGLLAKRMLEQFESNLK